MNFTCDSQIVKSYVLLISKDLRTFDDVPDLFNLRVVVQQCLEQ